MDYIIYPTERKNNKRVSLNEIDPIKVHCKHTINSLILKLIIKKGITFSIRQRANLELEICERKIVFWERQLDTEAIDISLAASQKALPDYIQTYATLLKWS